MGWLPGFPVFLCNVLFWLASAGRDLFLGLVQFAAFLCMPSMALSDTQVVSSTEGVPGSVRAKPRGNTQNRYWASVAAAGGLSAARITGSPVSMLRMCRI